MENNNEMRDAALAYGSRGWAVFPCHTVRDGICSCGNPDCRHPGKHPMIAGGHNGATVNLDTIGDWWHRWPDANIGFALPADIAVVDVDIRPDENKHGDATLAGLEAEYGPLPNTTMSRTGSGGVHYFFTTDKPLHCKTGLFPAIDFKTQGGYVILPPSAHISGNRYAWLPGNGLPEIEMATLPEWVAAPLNKPYERPKQAIVLPVNAIPEGERNDTLFKVAASLRSKGLSEEALLAALVAENNAKCLPPLDESEVAQIAHSAGKYEPGTPDKGAEDEGRPTQAEKLLELVHATGATFFHDETDVPFAVIPNNGHTEVLPIGGTVFSKWLLRLYHNEVGKMMGFEALKQALAQLATIAHFDNPEPITLHTRVAEHSDAFWYDLTNPVWQAIRITADGWTVEDNPPIMFTRYRHQNAQVVPQPGGDIRKILDYVNIKGMDTLFLCWMVSCFVPGIAHPMSILYGGQGAAKSTASELLKKLLDPSALDTLSLDSDLRSLFVSLQQHWFLPFDNVSHVKKETSDTLCKAITGNGIQLRKLFTDAEDIILTFKRCLLINGINNVATRPDLLDRSILVELFRIEEVNRRELTELMAAFEADRPLILGGILDTLSRAMAIYPSVRLERFPRMADFTRWGYAIGEALGGKGQEFLDQYEANRQQQNTQALSADLVATLVVNFMEDKSSWEGRVSDLLAKLRTMLIQLGISVPTGDFPKSPSQLARRLNVIKANLGEVGILYSSEHTRTGSRVTLVNADLASPSSHRHQPNEINASGGDGSVTISSDTSATSSPEIVIQGNLCDDGDACDDVFEVTEEPTPWD